VYMLGILLASLLFLFYFFAQYIEVEDECHVDRHMYKFCSTSTTIHYCQSWHDDDDDIFGIESEKRIYVEKYTIKGVEK